MVLLHGRAGRLTAKNGGFRPGQSTKTAVMLTGGRLAFFGYQRLSADERGPTCICAVLDTNSLHVGWTDIQLPMSNTTLTVRSTSGTHCGFPVAREVYPLET